MTKQPAFIGIVALIAVALLIIYGISALAPTEPQGSVDGLPSDELKPVTEPSIDFANPSLGPSDAPLTIVIYSDYICSSCATMQASLVEVLPKFAGDVRLVWKDLPNTSLHPDAKDAAIAARCAGEQGAFWQYHDILFARTDTVRTGGFMLLAEEIGLDPESFRDCLAGRETAALVERDTREAISLAIDATPYMFIGERRYSGAIDPIQLEANIRTALAAATAE
jgi:protein-disulfide isomerase